MNNQNYYSNIEMCRICPSETRLSNLYHPQNLKVREIINLMLIDIEVSFFFFVLIFQTIYLIFNIKKNEFSGRKLIKISKIHL